MKKQLKIGSRLHIIPIAIQGDLDKSVPLFPRHKGGASGGFSDDDAVGLGGGIGQRSPCSGGGVAIEKARVVGERMGGAECGDSGIQNEARDLEGAREGAFQRDRGRLIEGDGGDFEIIELE